MCTVPLLTYNFHLICHNFHLICHNFHFNSSVVRHYQTYSNTKSQPYYFIMEKYCQTDVHLALSPARLPDLLACNIEKPGIGPGSTHYPW